MYERAEKTYRDWNEDTDLADCADPGNDRVESNIDPLLWDDLPVDGLLRRREAPLRQWFLVQPYQQTNDGQYTYC